MSREIRLALVQVDAELKNVSKNVDHALEILKEKGREKPDIVVFPELFSTGYSPALIGNDYFKLAEKVDGPSITKISKIAKEIKSYVIAPIAIEGKMPGVLYNSAVIINRRGEVVDVFSKVHLWAGERFYFQLGSAYPVIDADFGRFAVMICYDAGFPEVTRIYALKGAELVLAPSAFPKWDKDMWDIYFPARSLENAFFVAGINRIGHEGEIHMFGNNKIANPRGKIIAEAPEDEEFTLMADIDLDDVRQYRQSVPFLRDRRVSTYELICKGEEVF